jgi:hypothetical protein
MDPNIPPHTQVSVSLGPYKLDVRLMSAVQNVLTLYTPTACVLRSVRKEVHCELLRCAVSSDI